MTLSLRIQTLSFGCQILFLCVTISHSLFIKSCNIPCTYGVIYVVRRQNVLFSRPAGAHHVGDSQTNNPAKLITKGSTSHQLISPLDHGAKDSAGSPIS